MYRLGRKQKRVILDENGHEVAIFNKEYKHLAQATCDLLNVVNTLNLDSVTNF
jgi:hypothetical protein